MVGRGRPCREGIGGRRGRDQGKVGVGSYVGTPRSLRDAARKLWVLAKQLW